MHFRRYYQHYSLRSENQYPHLLNVKTNNYLLRMLYEFSESVSKVLGIQWALNKLILF